MTGIRVRRAAPADRPRLAELLGATGPAAAPGVPAPPGTAGAPGGAQVWVAEDPGHGALLGTVTTPPPGGRLDDRRRPGELGFGRLAVAGAAREAGRRLVEHVVALARARYAVAAVVDASAEPGWLPALLGELGFHPAPRRAPASFVRDLSAGADGSPTRVLDNPALASLNGHHARFARRRGEVARYPEDVSPWTGIPDTPTARDWADIEELFGPGGTVSVSAAGLAPPAHWTALEAGTGGVQMTGDAVPGRPDPGLVELGPDDVPEILALIDHARPGPYLPRTIEMGRYLGVRDGGRLVAMAGERLHPPGWTEISAVCTDAAHRGHGLATRLVLAVAHGIRERGETPFLHAAAGNTNAIRLYERLGFRLRRRPDFRRYRIPLG